jgi:hypothetical protein
MYMCEDYNSPQSVYWCLKTLIAVSLTQADEFWTAEEEPYPSFDRPVLVPTPKQILCNHPAGNHHFFLSPAQFVAWPMKASQAKYCKFAYSSSFPFSVPTGLLIQQLAPDNTLALSRDGAETWAVKWKCDEVDFSTVKLATPGGVEEVMAATVRWYPWGDRPVQVDTTLLPPTDSWPDWHVRIHKIKILSPIRTLHAIEGGFAGPGRRKADGTALPVVEKLENKNTIGSSEGTFQSDSEALILSYAGASGIAIDPPRRQGITASCSPLKPDSNTSLAYQRSLIPVAAHDVVGGLEAGSEIILVTKVFAISTTANGGRKVEPDSIATRWAKRPEIEFGSPAKESRVKPHIIFPQ